MRLSAERIAAARRVIDPSLQGTPVVRDGDVLLKDETAGPLGCFKGRGADLFVAQLGERTPLVCASAGNFGLALADAGRRRGVPVTVFVSRHASPRKVARIRAAGGEVVVAGEDFDAAKDAARAHAARLDAGDATTHAPHPARDAGDVTAHAPHPARDAGDVTAHRARSDMPAHRARTDMPVHRVRTDPAHRERTDMPVHRVRTDPAHRERTDMPAHHERSDMPAHRERTDMPVRSARAVFVEDGDIAAISEGAGTIAAELDEQVGFDDLDIILVPVGNGALVAGIGTWMRAHHPHTRVIGVCAAGAPVMRTCWLERRVVEPPGRVDTIADGIAVRVPVPAAVDDLSHVVDDMVLVDDDQLRAAVQGLRARTGIVAEPSAVAGLALAHRFTGRIATILTGGNV